VWVWVCQSLSTNILYTRITDLADTRCMSDHSSSSMQMLRNVGGIAHFLENLELESTLSRVIVMANT
jgi:hypothetical protein